MKPSEDNIMQDQEAQDTALASRNPAKTQPAAEKDKLAFLFDVPLKVSVEVGRSTLLVKDLLQMREGYIVELDKLAGEPLDLYINSRLIARGEAVLVNDKFGLRLTEVISPSERIRNLG